MLSIFVNSVALNNAAGEEGIILEEIYEEIPDLRDVFLRRML